MASKWMKGILALSVILGAVSGSAAWGQTPDGATPANEGVCDDLMLATPGLYGLCVAFCEAQDCEPDFPNEDPFASCKPSSSKLLRVYNKKKRAGDPEMPCIRQAACPCWTEAELEALRVPGTGDETGCSLDAVLSPLGRFNWDQWQIRSSDGTTIVSTFENSTGPNCVLTNTCGGGDPNCAPTAAFLEISPTELAACEAQVSQSGADRYFGCF